MKTTTNAGIVSQSVLILRKRLQNITSVVIILWIIVLWWGERLVFQQSVSQCSWTNWETWPSHTYPQHTLLIADPQLVDPHTYLGRPWPLSTLTIKYTDLYLRRCYNYLQNSLQPDATIFLGDLFDGGREWATQNTKSEEKQLRKYDTNYWIQEYLRFSHIFLRPWTKGSSASHAAPMGRRIMASVPGNHDLGFASGIQSEVKNRFDGYFGPLNRVDIIGNHTIVSLDTVSLSAMDQVDPQTGSSGAGDTSAESTASSKIWKPVEDFLTNAKYLRERAIEHEYRALNLPSLLEVAPAHTKPFQPDVVSLHEPTNPKSPQALKLSIPSSQFPTIILSHVPLFRSATTSCGPLRERGSAIPLSHGYQYQNVLTPLISQDIVKHLVPEEIAMIYSGDDHDYCEIEHGEFTGRIKEITVKSMSWAMGIRKPGVQLVSLWNPISMDKIVGSDIPTPKDTVQNHLCLLPDQLSIFIRYGQAALLTLMILIFHAIRSKPRSSSQSHTGEKSEPLLPLSHSKAKLSQTSSASSSPEGQNQYLSTRKLGGYGNLPTTSRSRSQSPSKSSHGRSTISDPFAPLPYSNIVRADVKNDSGEDDWGMPSTKPGRRRKGHSRTGIFVGNLWNVAWPVLLVYFWLIWNG